MSGAMLSYDVDINSSNNLGATALGKYVRDNSLQCIEYLLKKGAGLFQTIMAIPHSFL